MAEYTKELLKKGFWNKDGKLVLEGLSEEARTKFIDSLSDKDAEKYAEEEEAENLQIQLKNDPRHTDYIRTGYPSPLKRYRLIYESAGASIESAYYWVLSQLRIDLSFAEFHKVTDNFTASEQSSMWGGAQSRMKIQQDTVSQYMATIGNMLKNMFQLVRELRIMDERLELYDNWSKSKSADVTLKGLYIDLVEGATKNPGSVYGLAQNVGFTILPDLFFNTQVFELEKIDEVVDKMKYNQQIKNILKRKLYSYVNWKYKTDKELRTRRQFQIKYLKQHWSSIKMYMEWIKPYLRNVRRMQMKEKNIESVDIVSAFETAITEIEFVAVKSSKTNKHPVISASFRYISSPELSFQKDQYAHRGPVHVGRVEMEFRAYAWSKQEIENYKTYRRDEALQIYSTIDESVKAAMDALGEDIQKYLREAEGIKPEEEEKNKKITAKSKVSGLGMLDPFVAVFKGFGEILGALIPIKTIIPQKKKTSSTPKDEGAAGISASKSLWLVYKNYKKGHGLITW